MLSGRVRSETDGGAKPLRTEAPNEDRAEAQSEAWAVLRLSSHPDVWALFRLFLMSRNGTGELPEERRF
jgi:hypothetical protein